MLIALVAFTAYGSYKYHKLIIVLETTRQELASTTVALEGKTASLLGTKTENADLHTKLSGEIARNDFFNAQIQSISATVGTLDKLSKTDRELLQKYSSVYFLNENYIPSLLSDIDLTYLYRKQKPEKIHANVKSYLERLLVQAQTDSISVLVLSAYRSFGTQATLKASYKKTYGAATANKFSAEQGYSEHQLGSTVDFTTPTTGESLTGFEKTSAYPWLLQNAYKFGFILSYPQGNTFFKYEPWHWRFVGVELATKLQENKKYFYDLDQREIDTYLVKIFD